MFGVQATYRHGTVELLSPVEWPEGTPLEVIPVSTGISPPSIGQSGVTESYREFIERLAGSFGDEPFERPPQGEFEHREEW